MGSLKLSISVNKVDSKKFSFSVNSIQLPDPFPISSVASCIHVSRACIISSLNRVKHIKVPRLGTEFENDLSFRHESKRIYYGTAKKETRKEVDYNVYFRKDIDGQLDVDYSLVRTDLSLERCNAILKRLEKCSDLNTLKFFEWMRNNGKLERNVTAYNLVLRVLGRREEWEKVEELIEETCKFPGSELNFQVFNTVIYSCFKKGYVQLGLKWFRMMLEHQVQPNEATFGTLMRLFQKNRNVEEAEFAFSTMRSLGIVCESAYSAMITIYTRLRLYVKAEEIIGLMMVDKVELNSENWLVILNAYSQQGKLDQAEAASISMQKAGIPPNIVAYNTLITGYGKVSNMDAAQQLFRNLEGLGLVPDETTFRSMIEGWGRLGNYNEANFYYEELKRFGYKPNSSNLHTLINLQAKYGDKEGATRILDDMLKIGCEYSSILGILLQAYEKVGRINLVPSLLNGVFYKHALSDQTSCSMIVMSYIKHGLATDAMALLKNKEWKDSAFEANLYHLLICSCKESGQLDDAVMIYNQMVDANAKPNLHVTCTMIDTYCVMGRFLEAERLYDLLKSSGVRLDMIGFSIVVRMYIKAGSLGEACSVLETMEKQKDIVPDIYLFRDMLRIYQKCGMLDKLADLYYYILKSGVAWDQEMYNCVINCCARALPVYELSRVLDEMLQRGFTPNTITYNVMLHVYGKSKLFKKVRKLFLIAKKQGLVDVISYNTIIAAYGENKKFEKMSSTVREMQFDGFSVSLEAYNSMLDAYGKDSQMESFRSVLKRMKESSCDSDHYTYNTMINIYGEKGWIGEVEEVLTELTEHGLGPDLCSYNTLIKAYGIAGMVEAAVGLVQQMRHKGIVPDKVTYINLITALRRNDKFLEAVKWSLWMKQMGL